jgi:hypothetical protein
MLRAYFQRHLPLLKHLCTAAYQGLTLYRSALCKFKAHPAIILTLHTFGEYLDFHPHIHALVADGLFTRDGQFHPLPELPIKPLEEIFRAHVIQLLVDLDLLGVKPMNQFDASASPMRECFTSAPDLTPYEAVPSNVPIDQMNPPAKAHLNPVLRRDALVSAKLNFREVDRAPEDVLNRILWNAMAGPSRPFPTWAVTSAPDADDKPPKIGRANR